MYGTHAQKYRYTRTTYFRRLHSQGHPHTPHRERERSRETHTHTDTHVHTHTYMVPRRRVAGPPPWYAPPPLPQATPLVSRSSKQSYCHPHNSFTPCLTCDMRDQVSCLKFLSSSIAALREPAGKILSHPPNPEFVLGGGKHLRLSVASQL